MAWFDRVLLQWSAVPVKTHTALAKIPPPEVFPNHSNTGGIPAEHAVYALGLLTATCPWRTALHIS